MATFTLLEPDAVHEVEASVHDARVVVEAASLARATGWSRRPEGLCRGDVCIPVRADAALDAPGGVDLDAFAAALRRPLAVDVEHRAAFLGESASTRAAALESLEAPDFTLPSFDGPPVSLASLRGRKVFLVAWASW